jgi:hypothetical protein
MRPRLGPISDASCGDGPLRDGAFLRKETRTGRQMDQDLHGKMVADVYLTLFSHHWALVTAPSTAVLTTSARGWSGGAEKLAYHLF